MVIHVCIFLLKLNRKHPPKRRILLVDKERTEKGGRI